MSAVSCKPVAARVLDAAIAWQLSLDSGDSSAVEHEAFNKWLASSEALDVFFDVRKVPGLKKKPSTSELVDWLKLLMADNIGEAVLRERDPTKAIPPLAGALVKNEQDVQLLERLAFMSRRGTR